MSKNNELANHLLAFATYAVMADEDELEDAKRDLREMIDSDYYHGQIDDIVEYAIKWLDEDHFQNK